ncbi:hypothetical protein BASA81_015135 [Batrachochytrium salamandrivorans]|nr:hypothetical protein BASA81_015135 [Batrachochytrium salamandrivorans]
MDDFQTVESEPFLEVTVQLVRPTDNGADISALLVVSTNLPQYLRRNYSLTRTLAEFNRLHLHLMHTNSEYIGPAPPPKSTNLEFVRTTLERFLYRLSKHEHLRIVDGTRSFIEERICDCQQEVSAYEAYFSAIGRINEKIALISRDICRSSLDVSPLS